MQKKKKTKTKLLIIDNKYFRTLKLTFKVSYYLIMLQNNNEIINKKNTLQLNYRLNLENRTHGIIVSDIHVLSWV